VTLIFKTCNTRHYLLVVDSLCSLLLQVKKWGIHAVWELVIPWFSFCICSRGGLWGWVVATYRDSSIISIIMIIISISIINSALIF